MTGTLAPSAPPRRRSRPPLEAVAAVVFLALLWPMQAVLQDPPRADITFANTSRWTVGVVLERDGDDSRILLPPIPRNERVTMAGIPRPSGQWHFRFTFGEHTASMRLDDRLGDHVDVPEALLARLRAARVAPSPY